MEFHPVDAPPAPPSSGAPHSSGEAHRPHQLGIDEPLDLLLVVVDGVSVELVGAIEIEFHPMLIPSGSIHVEIRLHDALVVTEKLEINLVLVPASLPG